MKKTAILISIFFTIALNAQEIKGTFFEGTDSLSFTGNNSITFSIRGNDALGVIFNGEGTYKITDNFIIINTGSYSGNKTTIEANPSTKKDTLQIQFFNEEGYSIEGVRAEFLNKKNKTIDLKVSNDYGIIYYKHNPKIVSIKVSDLLYSKAVFDYKANTDYKIHLIKSKILENKTVILKLIEKTENELTLKLLSTDFKREDPSISQLKKLDKKTGAIVDRARSFKLPSTTPEFNFNK